VASTLLGNQANVDLAALAAREAFGFWGFEITPEQLGEHVEKQLEIHMQRQNEMAQLVLSLGMGAPIDMAVHSEADSGTCWIQNVFF
jgi:acyl-CoA reductase-like NAD-dependent aldehyde dehydrogenase